MALTFKYYIIFQITLKIKLDDEKKKKNYFLCFTVNNYHTFSYLSHA